MSKKDFNRVTLWIFGIHPNLCEAQTSKINRTNKQKNHRTLRKSETCLCFKRHEKLITTIWITLCSTVHCVKHPHLATPEQQPTLTGLLAGLPAQPLATGNWFSAGERGQNEKAGYQCGYLVFLWHSPHDLFAASSTIILLQRRVATTTSCQSLGGD